MNARLMQAVRLAVNHQKNKLELIQEIEHRKSPSLLEKAFHYNCKW